LKQLCDVVKAQKLQEASAEVVSSAPSPPKPGAALQERSPNRKSRSAPTCSKATPDYAANVSSPALLTACSSAALQYLDSLAANSTAEKSGYQNALLILLDRTITMKLADEAHHQLAYLHNQYCSHRPKPTTIDLSQRPPLDKLVLGRTDMAEDPSTSKFVTSLQCQAIRLALLLGPACITKSFLEAVRLRTAGSPAWLLDKAYHNRRLTAEQAGSQLRTISLALSRLYNFAIKARTDDRPSCLDFDLFSIALQIKFQSWCHLRHQISPAGDVWKPLHSAVRKLFAQPSAVEEKSIIVVRFIDEVRRALCAAKVASDLPVELIETLLQYVREPGVLNTISNWYAPGPSRIDLILQLQSTTAWLQNMPHDVSNVIEAIKHATLQLDHTDFRGRTELDKTTLHVARLRKAAVQARSTAEQDAEDEDLLPDLRLGIDKLIQSVFIFLRRHTKLAFASTLGKCDESGRMAYWTTLLKTIEAVLGTLKANSTTSAVTLDHEHYQLLIACSAAIHELETDNQSSLNDGTARALQDQLRLRISQALWAQYLRSVEARKSPLEQAQVLEHSLQGLHDLPVALQKQAQCTLKYERLASCYLEAQKHAEGVLTLRKAIAASIDQGILADAVESLLRSSYDHAWLEPGHRALGKVFFAHIRAAFGKATPVAPDMLLYDDASLPAIHRVALLERQIMAALELDITALHQSVLRTKIEQTLELLKAPEYLLYAMRFSTQVLHAALQKRKDPDELGLPSHVVQHLLTSPIQTTGTVFLRTYDNELRPLLYLQYAFIHGMIDHEQVQVASSRLCDMILSCKSPDDAHLMAVGRHLHVKPLLLVVDYSAFAGDYGLGMQALQALLHMLAWDVGSAEISELDILTRIGKLQLLKQDPSAALTSFTRAEAASAREEPTTLRAIEFAIAFAEYHLQTRRLDECLLWLCRGQDVWKRRCASERHTSTKSRLREHYMLAQAGYLGSRLALEHSDLATAIQLARQSTKTAATLWASLEKLWKRKDHTMIDDLSISDSNNLSAEFSRLDLSVAGRPALDASNLPYATHVSMCCVVFSHMATLNHHCGFYEDAAMFYDQAWKVASKTGCSVHACITTTEMALLHARSGQTEKAKTILKELSVTIAAVTTSPLRALADVKIGQAHLMLGNQATAREYLKHAQLEWVEFHYVTLSKTTATARKKEIVPPIKYSAKKCAGASRKKIDQKPVAAMDSSTGGTADTLDAKRIHAQMLALEIQLEPDQYTSQVLESANLPTLDEPDIEKLLAMALYEKGRAISTLSNDTETNVLIESVVALPVRYRPSQSGGKISSIANGNLAANICAKTLSSKGSGTRVQKRTSDECDNAMLSAYGILTFINGIPAARLTYADVQVYEKVLAQLSVLSTALVTPFVASPNSLMHDNATAANLAWERHKYLAASELGVSKSDGRSWPDLKSKTTPLKQELAAAAASQSLEVLPFSWAVVKVSVSEDKNELLLTRKTRHKSPFIVRIPLSRSDLADDDENELRFETARAEMRDIVAKANASAHDIRGSSTDKVTRKAWFAGREELDVRLGTLLGNIENVWFGGFRGLLSSPGTHAEGLAKFGQALLRTLDSHLPSRQRSTKTSAPPIELHDHVLELFVSLRQTDDVELDDPVTDLLYFVVDILRFSGERNAYDEIDFDAMLVEVLDAISAYHEGLTEPLIVRHTILILDNDLQLFPWETLPCLRGHAVSRMPSMQSIYERLDLISAQSQCPDGYTIPANHGAYILNPSNDLHTTQSLFEPLLKSQYPGYSATVARPPSATEFSTLLTECSLVLYFGHGTGAQYLRPRLIRQLSQTSHQNNKPSCAVTLLMGCSSAKMTGNGVYLPSGMPWNYLQGGSMAMVGCLWDVTDRDIDRFSLDLLEHWGLLESGGGPKETKGMPIDKGKAKQQRKMKNKWGEEGQEKMSLDEAVALARDSCRLKYLNGAAPVVWGVPVCLG
jgi:separase